MPANRGVAQLGSASVLGAESPRFKSGRPDLTFQALRVRSCRWVVSQFDLQTIDIMGLKFQTEALPDSGVLSGDRLPGYARVDVAQADTLTLEILDGGDGINGDHGDWLHPLLFR